VVVGPRLNNYGLVDVDAAFVSTSLYSGNQLDQTVSRKISRATWLPV
jgi:hypothetical protein